MTGTERLRDMARAASKRCCPVDNCGENGGPSCHECWEVNLTNVADQVEREQMDGENRRVELCSALGIDAGTGWSDAMAELSRRLMPECYEWPRYESGDPVMLGGKFVNAKGNASVLRNLAIKDCRDLMGGEYLWRLGKGACAVELKPGERVKRPQVLAADGEPLEVGQTVYGTRDMNPVEVVDTHSPECGFKSVKCKDDDGFVFYCPDELIHQRPVLDADGVPIKVGDTVWCVATDDELADMNILRKNWSKVRERLTVKSFIDDAHGDKWADFEETYLYVKTCYLTHTKPEPPDSWDRIEKDAQLNPDDYWMHHSGSGEERENAALSMARDIMHRCIALAGVSE